MLLRLFLLFTAVPLLELLILVRVAGWAGALPTLLLVLGTGAAGAWLARREGARKWARIRSELDAGRVPAGELLEGFFVLVAGILLVTPGILTDAAGLLLLLPPVRRRVVRWARRRFAGRIAGGTAGGGLHFRAGGVDPSNGERSRGEEPTTGGSSGDGTPERPRRVIEL